MNAMKIWKAVGSGIQRAVESVTGGVVAGLSYLVGVWGTQATLNEAFSAMTAQQWGLFALAFLGGMGVGQAQKNRVARRA